MTKPKSWAETSQRNLAYKNIVWDGVATSKGVIIPPASKPVLIALDNQSETALTATLDQLIAIDDSYASVQIGEGENGVITITAIEPGSNSLYVRVDIPNVVNSALAVHEGWLGDDNLILIQLGTDANADADPLKNTASLIVAEFEEFTKVTAEASGTGATPLVIESGTIFELTGGKTEVWAPVYNQDGNIVQFSIGAEKAGCFGPVDTLVFPKFHGGRITLAGQSAPVDTQITRVIIQEV